MRFETPQPCSGPGSKLFRMRRSSVPCSRSARSVMAYLKLRQHNTALLVEGQGIRHVFSALFRARHGRAPVKESRFLAGARNDTTGRARNDTGGALAMTGRGTSGTMQFRVVVAAALTFAASN